MRNHIVDRLLVRMTVFFEAVFIWPESAGKHIVLFLYFNFQFCFFQKAVSCAHIVMYVCDQDAILQLFTHVFSVIRKLFVFSF